MTLFGLYFVVRLNQYFEHKQSLIIKYLHENNTFESERKELLKFAFIKRFIHLIDSSIKFAIAWAWRDSINAFILAVYEDEESEEDDDGGVWSYTIILTLFVTACYAVSDDYYIIYPKNKDEQNKFPKNKSRNIANKMIYDNLRFVVGLSWFDSINETIGFTDTDYVAENPVTLAVVYWIVAIVGIFLSVIGSNYCTKYELRHKIAKNGFVQAMLDTFENFCDPKCQFHDDDDSDMIPKILDNMMFEILNVTIGAWGVTGALSIKKAILWTVSASLVKGSIIEDASSENRDSTSILWISSLICLLFTTMFTAYIGRFVNAIKVGRRKLFEKMKKDKQKEFEDITTPITVIR